MHRMKSLALFAALLLAGTIGCQNDDFGVNSTAGLSSLEANELAVANLDDAIANVEDATLEKEMVMNPVFSGQGPFVQGPRGRGNGIGFMRHGQHPRPEGCHLFEILRQLQISDEQLAQIRELMAAHRETTQPIFEALRAANQDIIDAANAQREVILEAMRNGDLTREEAQEQLKALSEATRDAIRNNPDTEELRQQLCDAITALFDSVRSVLSEDQQSQWDEWVATLEGPCFGG